MEQEFIDLEKINYLIRQLSKVDSKLHSGQIIDAWRDNRRIISELDKWKSGIMTQTFEEKLEDE
jgi:hypothetical protein